MSSSPSLSVILFPSNEATLGRALDALAAQTIESDRFEVVVTGWSDASLHDLSRGRDVTVRSVAPATSTGTAANRAIAGASGALVLLLSDTIELGRESLAAHAGAHDEAGRRQRLVVESIAPADARTLFGSFMQATIDGPLPSLDDGGVEPMRIRWGSPLSMPRDLCVALGGLVEGARLDPILLTELEVRARREGCEVRRLACTGSVSQRLADLDTCCRDAESIGAALPALYDRHPESAAFTDLGTLLVAPVTAARLRTRVGELAALERGWLTSDRTRPGAAVELERVLRALTEGWHDVLTSSLALGVQQSRARAWPLDGVRRRQWLNVKDRSSSAETGPSARLGNPRQLQGLRIVAADSLLEPLVAAGRPAERLVRGPSGGWHLYAQFDHRPTADERSLTVTVDYLDNDRVVWGLEYDSRDASFQLASERPGAFKPAPMTVTNADSGEWRSARFTLADWRFERGCHGADFRVILLDVPGSGLIVHRVSVVMDGHASALEPPIAPDLTPQSFPTADDPAATVIVPVHNRLVYTAACLHALAESSRTPFEVVVVDNGSDDGTPEFLRQCTGVRGIGRARNDGFAVACNDGAALARAAVLVFLNNDTLPLPGWLDALLSALSSHPAIAVAGAKLLFPTDQALVQHAGMTLDGLQPVHRGIFAPPTHRSVCRSRVVPAVTGACLAIATREFRDAGGFDTGFLNGYEDVDLCLRLLQRRRLTYYCAESVLFHHGAISAGRFAHEDRNRTRFLERWGSALPALLPTTAE